MLFRQIKKPLALSSFLLGVAALGSSALLWIDTVRAQVSLSPLVLELKADRGQAEGFFNVVNNSDQPFRARVYTAPFTFDKERGFTTLPSSPTDLTPYLQFSPRELEIAPGVTRRVRFNVLFPPSIEDGEYRTVIFTEPLKEVTQTEKNGTSVQIKTRIGVTVFVRKGDVSPSITVESAHWNEAQKQIQLLIHNTGKASTYVSGDWTLKQGDKVVQTGEIRHNGLMRNTDRDILLIYTSKNPTPPAPGNYQLTGNLTWTQDDKPSSLPFSVNFVMPAQK